MFSSSYKQILLNAFIIFSVSIPLTAQQNQVEPEEAPKDSSSETAKPEQFKKLSNQIQKLQKENQLFKEKLDNELQSIKEKQKRLKEKLALKDLQKKEELSDVKSQIDKLETQLSLAQKETEKAIQEAKNKRKEIESELKLKKAEKESELSGLKLDLQEAQLKQQLAMTETKLKEAKLKQNELEKQIQLSKLKSEEDEMTAEISLRKTRRKWKSEVNDPIKYIDNPLQGKTLYITDRRVRLDGPIITDTGDWVSKRLHYFNNQSESKPIFLIINDSPGGSVMEGFRIIKTMKSIQAPVYVVVRERAASMAAAITTLADRSFAYPDAIILYHEIQASMGGSLKENESQLEMVKKWWKRLASPIADKMNMTIENFRNRMYEEDPNGNWQEFATEAKELNWVGNIITEIQDVGVREEPDDTPPSPTIFFLETSSNKIKKDDQGNRYRKLPPLRPFDFYFMYDPNNNYRW